MTTPEQRRKQQDARNLARAIRKALGLCRECGKAADGTFCESCMEHRNERVDPMFGGWVLYLLVHPSMREDGSDLYQATYYVGISEDMETRILRHLRQAESDQHRRVTQWIMSLPSDPILVIIAGGYKTFEDARIAEDNAIEKLRALGSPLVNFPTAKERAALKEKTSD